jgi:alpha-L-rhamnosidase
MLATPFDPVVEPFRSGRFSPIAIPVSGNQARFLPHALGLVLAFAGLISVSQTALATSSEGAAPRQLLCESMGNPLGIDIAHPLLSWRLQDTRRGARQTAYQIRVASSAEALAQGDVWDSGQVNSAQSVNVAYAGSALESRRRYYWQVRVWDQQGQASAYSEAS